MGINSIERRLFNKPDDSGASNTDRNLEEDRKNFEDATRNAIAEIQTDFEQAAAESFKREVGQSKVFILGETHGVLENPQIIYTLMKRFRFRAVALEWDKDLKESVDNFLDTGVIDFDAIAGSSDGRITAAHFPLLKRLRDENLLDKVVLFDSNARWDERDRAMADAINEEISGVPMLVVAGNLHARLADITETDNTSHGSMANFLYQLRGQLPLGKIEYGAGEYHNIGLRKFEPSPDIPAYQNASFSRNNEGVYIYSLPEAHAAIVPNPSEI